MAILSAPTLTNIKDGFPNQRLTPIVGEPSYATIKKMERELAPNAKSQRNPNSLYGYLQYMTQPAIYHALTNENLAIPPDPGDQAAYPAGTDELQRAQLDQTYSQRKIARITYENMDQALLSLIVPAIDPIYTSGIITGAALYQQRTVLDVLAYLYNTYGRITTIDLMRNEQEMGKPYDPSQPIMILFAQITDGAEYAQAGSNPFSVPQLVRKGEALIALSKAYPEKLREWENDVPNLQKTWVEFQRFFSAAYAEYKANAQISAQAAGFHSGYNATEQSEAPADATFENLYESVNNFAAASVADRSAFSSMTDANTAMAAQMAAKDAQIQQLNDRLTMMSMGSHFQQQQPPPPAAPVQQPPTQYGYQYQYQAGRGDGRGDGGGRRGGRRNARGGRGGRGGRGQQQPQIPPPGVTGWNPAPPPGGAQQCPWIPAPAPTPAMATGWNLAPPAVQPPPGFQAGAPWSQYNPHQQQQAPKPKAYNNTNYCWTHGHDVDDQHTSATCRNPDWNGGHQTCATKWNTMGGSNKNRERT